MLTLQDMKVTNTFFEHAEYTTHTSYLPPCLPQMLDIITVSSTCFKRIRYCKIWEWSVPSDHAGIICRISITSIKHSGESNTSKVSAGNIDWEKIEKESILRKRFNERLQELNGDGLTPYSNFMENYLKSTYMVYTMQKESALPMPRNLLNKGKSSLL